MFIRPTNVIQFLKFSLTRLLSGDGRTSILQIHPSPAKPLVRSPVEMRGLEPLTSSLQRRRSPD